jgi:cardiolipin synthase
MLVDDVWTLIGSANLDARSLKLNFELNLSVIDAAFASRVRSHFERVISPAQEISLLQLESRPLGIKLRDSFCHLFAPYL